MVEQKQGNLPSLSCRSDTVGKIIKVSDKENKGILKKIKSKEIISEDIDCGKKIMNIDKALREMGIIIEVVEWIPVKNDY